ncbi:MAG: deoxyribonuclease IV [Deltaproteobacteria bacterium]|nr:deoxyribonuclease IV [Deltaproteobacteria bacterium]MBN2845641.1 deoxyribonuclease IV [Deltaproteobacteria bacterium]
MSISGGLERALLRGSKTGCRTIQLFTKSPNRWEERFPEESEKESFLSLRRKLGISPAIAQDSHLINTASPDRHLYDKSFDALLGEMRRCEELEVDYLVMHPGAHRGSGEHYGIETISEALNAVHQKTEEYRVQIAVENTAGQGTDLGYTLGHIEKIFERVKERSRLAFCLDTCHIFAAGYDIRKGAVCRRLFEESDDSIGLENLKIIHMNDSERECGSRIDRHEDIGKGAIGETPFRWIMNDERLLKVPKIIETSQKSDRHNLRVLKKLLNYWH